MEKYTELLNELNLKFKLCKTTNDLIIAKNVFSKKHFTYFCAFYKKHVYLQTKILAQ